jgi:SAM-dependent methyltransferase
MANDQTIKTHVREHYGKEAATVAARGKAGCCGPEASCCGGDTAAKAERSGLYAAADLAVLPQTVAEASWGSGNPVAFADVQPGEVVLDLGSGGGLDCLLAARKAGPSGRAIGVDMTDEMLALARQNAAEAGAVNVEFRKGELEALPVADASVDVVISNCVINLSPDKDRVLAEAFRVLRPGGRFVVSDIVLLSDLPAAMRTSRIWCECVAGALRDEEFLLKTEQAGFVDVHIVPEGSRDYVPGIARSVLVRARKP